MDIKETLAADVIAGATKAIIADVFSATSNGGKKSFRVKNLTKIEIGKLLELLAADQENEAFRNTRIVVASDAPGDFHERFRADPDKSITYYRNKNPGGLIYIETKVESDEQGLKNIFTLRDINFLDGTFDNDGFDVALSLVENAFRAVRNEPRISNSIVSDKVLKVREELERSVGQGTSLRKFVKFLISVVIGLPESGVLDGREVDQLVGRSLIELDMFPDEDWNDQENRAGRRLQINLLHAQLASSTSSDLDPDKLSAQIERTVFRDPLGEPLSDVEQDEWRRLCLRYSQDPDQEVRKSIPYRLFEQIFQIDLKGLKLGERVEKEIEDSAPYRLNELDSLDVRAGLDRRSADDAQKFLDAEPEDEELSALRNLLSPQTRRMVEKVAIPTSEKVENPLLALALAVRRLRDRNDLSDGDYRLEMRLGRQHEGSEVSQGLLAFLYGRTLRSVAEQLASGAGNIGLAISPELTLIVPAPDVVQDDLENENINEENQQEVSWSPVPLEFVLFDNESGSEIDQESGVEWHPRSIEYLVLFWCSVAAKDSIALTKPHEISNFDEHDWVREIAARRLALGAASGRPAPASIPDDPIISELIEIRSAFRAEAAISGLAEALLNDTFDRWQALVVKAKAEFVPDGAPDDRLSTFISSDCILGFGGDGILMLPSHPLRLRWIARYLEASGKLASESAEGTLKLNESNPEAYLRWLEALSPQQQPAIHCASGPIQLYAAGETGWSEQFKPRETGGGAVTERRLASSLVTEIVMQIERYLHVLPYKTDGLSILVLAGETTSIAADIVSRLRRGEFANLKLSIELVTPHAFWPEATRLFDLVDSANRLSAGSSVQPPVELRLHDFQDLESPELDRLLSGLSCDIAVVPAFLGGNVKPQENTRSETSEFGSFKPLYDDPTHMHVGAEGSSVSVTMLPRNSDQALSAWSTLCVRNYRQHPLNRQDSTGTDYINMSVQFHHAARVFERLHQSAHWVVTVERHITRDQIERLEGRPDILVMRDKIGPGNRFSLVVSSNSGRDFIIGRLRRKIRHIIGSKSADEQITEFAHRIYEDTRNIAPRLTLEALGVSRVTEEIIGLSVAREICREHAPIRDGIEIWLSLDDQPHWFTGPSTVRADMLRIAFKKVPEGLDLEILVVESKLRSLGFDAHGTEQARATIGLLDEIFSTEEPRIDAELWREYILSAADLVDQNAMEFHGASAAMNDVRNRIPSDVREQFRDGNFRSVKIEAIYSICCYLDHGDVFIEADPQDDRVRIVRSSRNALANLLRLNNIISTLATKPAIPDATKTVAATADEASTAPSGERASESERHSETIELHVDECAPADSTAAVPPVDEVQSTRGRLTGAELAHRYMQILRMFEEYGVDVRRVDEEDAFTEGPSSVLYRVRPASGVDPARLSDKANALKLVLGLEEHQMIRFTIGGGYVQIDVPKSDEDRYFVRASDLFERWHHDPAKLSVPLGEDRFGAIVALDFSSSDAPHLLIGGTTGSGKSEALNTILEGLVRYYSPEQLQLLLIDPKGTELQHLDAQPHLAGRTIGWDERDAIELLTEAVGEMQRRYELLKTARTRSIADFNAQAGGEDRLPWWVLVLDEYADLTSDPEAKKEIEKLLKRLAQKARAAGIHMIIATQKPSGEVISTNLRSNLPAQLALRVRSSTESRVIMDDGGAEALNGKGDGLLKTVRGITRVQCAKV
jgi:S-DNA-T family DNA segregation ATPase FtsK/SpoIIIE